MIPNPVAGEGTNDGGGDFDDRVDARSDQSMQQIKDLVGRVELDINHEEHHSKSSPCLGRASYGAVVSQSFAGIARCEKAVEDGV